MGFNLGKFVVAIGSQYRGVGSEVIPKIGTGIGAGVSLNGLLCGCVSRVAIAIGMKYGRTSSEENPQRARSIWDELLYGSTDSY